MVTSTKVGEYTVVTYFDTKRWENITSIHDAKGDFLGPVAYAKGDVGAKLNHMNAIVWVEDNFDLGLKEEAE